jgi:hypothetical protein
MARPSSLEGRIRAMLNANVNRKPVTRWSRLFTVIALLGLTLPIAGLGAQSTFVTVSGSVLDGTNRVLPNFIVVLTSTSIQAKHEVRSDSTGRFEFVGVPDGEYVLEAKEPGFATFRAAIEAVRQWQFSTTLLNCTPIDVRMQVRVNFTIQP